MPFLQKVPGRPLVNGLPCNAYAGRLHRLCPTFIFIILYHIFLILSRQPAASRQPPPFCKCQKNVADIINPKIYPEKERQNEKNI